MRVLVGFVLVVALLWVGSKLLLRLVVAGARRRFGPAPDRGQVITVSSEDVSDRAD